MSISTAANATPKRTDLDPKLTWDLTHLYPTDSAWETEYAAIQQMVSSVQKFVGKLHESPSVLEECLKLQNEIGMRLHSLYQYAYLNKDLDNRVSKYQAMTERAAMLSSQAGAAFSFIEPELLKLDDSRLVEMEKKFSSPNVFDFYIRELIRSKAHIRSAEVEELLAMAGMIARGPDSIFSMLDDADLTYPAITDEEGNEVKLTKQRFAKYMESAVQRVRCETNSAFYSSYKSHLNTIGASLAASVTKDVFYTKARRYDSCLQRALDANNIPLSVYHSLLDTTEANISALHAYSDLRKRVLKLDQIWPYDMMCPLFPESDYTVPYADAVTQVIDAVQPLGSTYQKVLTDAFGSRWVDVFETEGKGSGAYSWGNYQVHPYVLMNYNDTVDNMFTLAHEMGHAMHSYLSNRKQPFAKAQYSIFVAEVASTLNEGLLLHSLLKKVTDTKQRLYLLNRHIDNTFGTFFHQVLYARFELIIHEEVEKGNALSPDFLTETWGNLTQKFYGPTVTMDEFTPLKWSRIPHFYNMFYVYQYATSYAASQAILKKFIDGEPGIIDKYLEMLSSGGKDHPIELLKICGVDMTKSDPVMATISLFREQVDEINRLVK